SPLSAHPDFDDPRRANAGERGVPGSPRPSPESKRRGDATRGHQQAGPHGGRQWTAGPTGIRKKELKQMNWLKETLYVTLATWAIDGAIDHWAFGHQHSAYHLASLISALAVGGMFFLWRYRERQYHREMHAFELRRRARQHTMSNKLQVIAI